MDEIREEDFGRLENPFAPKNSKFYCDFVVMNHRKNPYGYAIAFAPVRVRSGKLVKADHKWVFEKACELNAIPQVWVNGKWITILKDKEIPFHS